MLGLSKFYFLLLLLCLFGVSVWVSFKGVFDGDFFRLCVKYVLVSVLDVGVWCFWVVVFL